MSKGCKATDETFKPSKEHVSIPWDFLKSIEPENATLFQFKNRILDFAYTYNYYRDKNDEGQAWAELVLTNLTHAETLEDLRSFTPDDWYICALLLQSNLPVPRIIIGKLIEQLVTELTEAKIDVPVLGIEKPRRGRPSSSSARLQHLFYLAHEVRALTEKQGMTASAAYEEIAKKQHKSPDTIRRDYERFMARNKRRNEQLAGKDPEQQ